MKIPAERIARGFSQGPRIPGNYVLLAEAGEPPAARPVTGAAANDHVALAAPAVEGEITPPSVGILPMSTVGVVVRESRIRFIDGGEGIRIGGLKAAQLVLFLQVVVSDGTIDLKENHFRLCPLSAGHDLGHVAVGVLVPTSGVENLLRSTGAVHLHAADDHIADRFYVLAERSQKFHTKILDPKHLLDRLGSELFAVFAHRGPELVHEVVNLAIGH